MCGTWALLLAMKAYRRRSARAAAERRSGLEQRGGQRAPRIALAAAELQDVVSFYLGFRGSTY